ncbi:altronate dehydratase family protein [Salinisphaera sp.]|uniref:UxaA family hydrolase n=1 Tax=Salinisphaera sp. TaxID=1914330 RepID=UPI002D79F358|nr:altronate dehydratase family protein [Salinisphaera sp.]HET7314236.1 altronate dehydratase family protein [Salinisphaera sp.]
MSTSIASDSPTIRLHDDDNVCIVRNSVSAGATLANPALTALTARADISAGHKIATCAIKRGQPVLRYGQVIGFASSDIEPGAHVHLHNLAMGEISPDHAFCRDARPTRLVSQPAVFNGYRRADGRVGTRNYIAIVSSVNCSATAARHIADGFRFSGELERYDNVDGVIALTHQGGCGLADSGEGFELLKRTLQGYADHPNVAAVLFLGLGCEVMQVGGLQRIEGLRDIKPVRSMTIQQTGGTRRTIERATALIRELLPEIDRAEREPVPASELCVALQCGGSDSYSGISANPALGHAVDRLVEHGGTAILSETPEIYGAEHLLTRRAASPAVAEKLLERIRWWQEYTRREGAQMNNNPSPGNKAGGITTILEKSLGAVAKGGTTNLVEVYEYAERVRARGLVYMDTPGYDPVSATGQVAGGANLVCFTTGRGSAFGSKPAPSIKLATNSELYQRQTEDMDINCGTVLTGEQSLADCGDDIFARMLAVASGEPSKSEAFGYGDNEFVPWQLGATM